MASPNQTSFNFYKSGLTIQHTDALSIMDSAIVIPYHRCSVKLKVHRNDAGTITDTFVEFTVRHFDGSFDTYVLLSTDNTRPCNTEGWVLGGFLAGTTVPGVFISNYVSYALNQVYNGN